MKYYSAIKKNETVPFAATWMDIKIIILSDMSDRQRQISCDITYMWNLKMIQMNLFTKQNQTHRRSKQTYGYQSGEINRKYGINRHTHSTGSYIQYPVINYNGKIE